jgi:hypothetical protein
VLQVFFSLLGAKVWIQVAGVNRQWREVYTAMTQSKETSAVYALATLSTYAHAKVCGKDSKNSCEESKALGQHAGLDVIARYADHLWVEDLVRAAFKSKRADVLHILQGLISYIYPDFNCCTSLLCQAALHGNLECLRFMTTDPRGQAGRQMSNATQFQVSLCAAEGGHLPILQWLRQHWYLRESTTRYGHLSDIAVAHGRMDAVIWLYKQGFVPGPQACTKAAAAGTLQVLLWLRKHSVQWVHSIGVAAAEGGSVEVLQYLYDNAVGDWDAAALKRMLSYAAHSNHLAAVQWLHSKGAELPECMWTAACWTDLSTLRWAMDSGVSWGTPLMAGTCSHLRRLLDADAWQWAHEHGCPCDCTD